MTVKKPIKKKEELPTDSDEELAFDLDPTTNDELHETIFEKLKKKIQSNNEKYVKKTSRNNLLNFKCRYESKTTSNPTPSSLFVSLGDKPNN